MSEVKPPVQPPVPPHIPAGGYPKAVVVDPPKEISSNLLMGARFKATLYSSSQKGNYEIETPYGRLTLQTTTPLPNDGTLQLQLTSKGNQLQFLITMINGQSPLTALRSLGLLSDMSKDFTKKKIATNKASSLVKGSSSSLISGGLQGTNTLVNSATLGNSQSGVSTSIIGINLTATLLNATANNSVGQSTTVLPSVNNSQLTSGSAGRANDLPGKALTGSTPKSTLKASLSQQTSEPQKITNRGGFTPLAPIQTAPNPGQRGLPPGSQITVRIIAFKAPSATSVVVPIQAGRFLSAPGSILTGTVSDMSLPSGHQVVLTHAGSLAIAASSSLPIGSQVTLKVISLTQLITSTTGEVAANETPSSQLLLRQWPALQEAVRILGEFNPAAAQQLIQAVLPKPGSTLGGNIIFYLMALSGGNLPHWLGDLPTRTLQLSKPELLARLKKDFSAIERNAHSASNGEWRSTMIPFHDGIEINPLRLSIRCNDDENQKNEPGGNDGTKFIIDLDINLIGRFQIDGLVYRERKRLDLIVRTNNRLPQNIEDGIRSIFQDATDVIGLLGGVVFQASPPIFVETSDSKLGNELVGLLV